MSAATKARRVRVVLEGTATEVRHSPDLLRLVRQDGGVVLIPTDSPGVEVVRLPDPWTDQDAVLRGECVWTRIDGRWVTPGLALSSTDANVDDDVAEGRAEILRRQTWEPADG